LVHPGGANMVCPIQGRTCVRALSSGKRERVCSRAHAAASPIAPRNGSDCQRRNTPTSSGSIAVTALSSQLGERSGCVSRSTVLIGVRWRRIGDKSISVARVEDVAVLDTFIGPKR